MELSFRTKKEKPAVIPVETRLLTWPDCYYQESEPEVRLQLLEAADARNLTPEDNEVRHFLFEHRYERSRLRHQ